jgi:hypothetical protein
MSDLIQLQFPEEPFILHAFKALQLLIERCSSTSTKKSLKHCQCLISQDEKNTWESLKNLNNSEIYKYLKESLPIYKKTINPRFYYEIESMIGDVEYWLSLND